MDTDVLQRRAYAAFPQNLENALRFPHSSHRSAPFSDDYDNGSAAHSTLLFTISRTRGGNLIGETIRQARDDVPLKGLAGSQRLQILRFRNLLALRVGKDQLASLLYREESYVRIGPRVLTPVAIASHNPTSSV